MSNFVRYMFLRRSNSHIVGCLAIKLSEDKSTVTYQYSAHNPKDRFSRSEGRAVALSHLETNPIYLSKSTPPFGGMNDITRHIMSDLKDTVKAPSRLRKAADVWLKQKRA